MRKKLGRFLDISKRKNVLEQGKDLFENTSGKWNNTIFNNQNDIVVEVGCGRGEYTVGLGKRFSERNFVGVDIKGDRIWIGSTEAMDLGLENVYFLRTEVNLLDRHFGKNEISEIWITFPDPRPKDRDIKRRLTSLNFMKIYKTLLKENGWIKFKTDNTALFNYTLELCQGELNVKNLVCTHDLYGSELNEEHFELKTKYEQLFYDKGELIKYMKFQFQE